MTIDESIEVWKVVPGFLSYEASSLGRVRRCVASPKSSLPVGGVMKTRKMHGYHALTLCKNGKRQHFYLNVLICLTFHGPKPAHCHDAAHLDGDTDHNWKDNIAWATRKENIGHRKIHGTDAAGERNGNAKLGAEDIIKIRSRHQAGESQNRIARSLGLTSGYVSKIVRNVNWSHLPGAEPLAEAATEQPQTEEAA